MIPTKKILEASVDYAANKSSADVFKLAHKNDFLAGAKWYEENSNSLEILDSLKYALRMLKNSNAVYDREYIENLIKSATE